MDKASPTQRLHPVLWVAAVAVTLLSVAGIGAITGWIPTAGSTATKPDTQLSLPTADPATAPTLTPAAQTAAARSAEPPAAAKQETPPSVAKTAAPKSASKPVAAKAVAAGPATEPAAPATTPAMVAETSREVAPAPVAEKPRVCPDCGVVSAVREVKQEGEGSGLGAVAGGVVGGLLGNQIGKGRGNTVATVAGVVGGAVAGHQIEKNVKTASHYEISVRMDDGSTRVVGQDQPPAWRSGDRVKIVNGMLVAND